MSEAQPVFTIEKIYLKDDAELDDKLRKAGRRPLVLLVRRDETTRFLLLEPEVAPR